MTLTADILARVRASHTSALDLGTAELPLAVSTAISLASGTGANQADRLWSDTRTISASSNDDLDLAGVLTDVFGTTLTFARIKLLFVKAASANTNNVIVGGSASNPFLSWIGSATDKVTVRPGGFLMLAAPDATAYAVTAATGDILRLTNSSSGSTVTYDIVVVGASA